jgi:hypothetical protein
MCQGLVNKVAQSRELMAIAEPELLVLFEDWLEELEEETISCSEKHGPPNPKVLAERLGLSERSAKVIISKLKKEGKL